MKKLQKGGFRGVWGDCSGLEEIPEVVQEIIDANKKLWR